MSALNSQRLSHYYFTVAFAVLLGGLIFLESGSRYKTWVSALVMLPGLFCLAIRWRETCRLLVSPVLWPLLLFLAYALGSFFWQQYAHAYGVDDLLKASCYILVITLLFSLQAACVTRALLWASLPVAAAAGWMAVDFYTHQGFPLIERLGFQGSLANALVGSAWLGIYLPVCLYGVGISTKRWQQWAFYGLAIVVVICVILSQSRTPPLGWFAALATVMAFGKLRFSRTQWLVVLLAGMLLGGWVIGNSLERGSSFRSELLKQSFYNISQRPWFGHGFYHPPVVLLPDKNYEAPYRLWLQRHQEVKTLVAEYHALRAELAKADTLQDRERIQQRLGQLEPVFASLMKDFGGGSHNVFMDVAYYGGFVGLVLWGVMFVVPVLFLLRQPATRESQLALAWLAYSGVCQMSFSETLPVLKPNVMWFFTWLPLALGIAVSRMQDKASVTDIKSGKNEPCNGAIR